MLKEMMNADTILTCDMLLAELDKNFVMPIPDPYGIMSSIEDVHAAVVVGATLDRLDEPLSSNGIIDITATCHEITDLVHSVYNTREEYTEAQGELFKIAVTQIMLLKVEKLKQFITELRDSYRS